MQITLDPVFQRLIPYLRRLDHRPAIIEIGAHDGTTSAWLKASCRMPPHYWAFEPDPRNLEVLRQAGHIVSGCAISDHDDTAPFYLSGGLTPGFEDRVHTDSSSLKRPTAHLERYPWCTFEEAHIVQCWQLDTIIPIGVEPDLIWCDVQGAQLEVIRGGQMTLSKTRLLYIEVHPEPLYEGEPSLRELVAVLPGDWEVIEIYAADVLLRNRQEERND